MIFLLFLLMLLMMFAGIAERNGVYAECLVRQLYLGDRSIILSLGIPDVENGIPSSQSNIMIS
jgi:hypothetical protein